MGQHTRQHDDSHDHAPMSMCLQSGLTQETRHSDERKSLCPSYRSSN